jgi:hypothetical protein
VTARDLKKCCISSAVDGKDDDILWEDVEEGENSGTESDEVGSSDSEGNFINKYNV